jgi:hypothetical protein
MPLFLRRPAPEPTRSSSWKPVLLNLFNATVPDSSCSWVNQMLFLKPPAPESIKCPCSWLTLLLSQPNADPDTPAPESIQRPCSCHPCSWMCRMLQFLSPLLLNVLNVPVPVIPAWVYRMLFLSPLFLNVPNVPAPVIPAPECNECPCHCPPCSWMCRMLLFLSPMCYCHPCPWMYWMPLFPVTPAPECTECPCSCHPCPWMCRMPLFLSPLPLSVRNPPVPVTPGPECTECPCSCHPCPWMYWMPLFLSPLALNVLNAPVPVTPAPECT